MWIVWYDVERLPALQACPDSCGVRWGGLAQVVVANAWHHRSDALSSLIAIVGVAGAMAGAPAPTFPHQTHRASVPRAGSEGARTRLATSDAVKGLVVLQRGRCD